MRATKTDTLVELSADLDKKNAEVARLTKRDLKRGIGPSAEHRTAYREALVAYRNYWNVVDGKGGAA